MGARDEVAVEVHDGLACRLAAIHPHVVAVRLVALLDPGFRQVQNRRQRPLLFRRQAEPVRARAVGDALASKNSLVEISDILFED